MNPLVTYSLARLVIFVGTLRVLIWAGAGQVWAIILAAVISMLLSYVLLRGLRDQVAVQVAERVSRRTAGRGSGSDEQVEDDAVEEAATGADLPGDAFQTLLGPRADTAQHAARFSGPPSPQLPLSSPFSSPFSSQSDASALSPAAARRRLTLIALGAAAFAVPATIAALVLLAPGLSPALLVTLALTGGSAVLVGLPVLAMVGRIGRRAASGPPVTSEPAPDRRRPHSPVGTPRRTTAQRRAAAQAPRPPSGSAGARGARAERTRLALRSRASQQGDEFRLSTEREAGAGPGRPSRVVRPLLP